MGTDRRRGASLEPGVFIIVIEGACLAVSDNTHSRRCSENRFVVLYRLAGPCMGTANERE